MNLELRSIVEAGNIEKERITLRAASDVDLGKYILCQSEYRGGSATTRIFSTFWFPDKQVKEGDLVIIYTKSGTSATKKLSTRDGMAHFFYWGLKNAIWNQDDRAAILMRAPTWEAKPTDELLV